MQPSDVIAQIQETQRVQDTQGHEFPGQTNTYSFPAPFALRLALKFRRIKGLEFTKYMGEWFGVFRAQKHG